MIIARVTYLAPGAEPGRDSDWGEHVFMVLPRPGELVYVLGPDGGSLVRVSELFHYPSPLERNDVAARPSVIIRTTEK